MNLARHSNSPSSRLKNAHFTGSVNLLSKKLPPIAAAASFWRSRVVFPSLGRPAMMLMPSKHHGSHSLTGSGILRSRSANTDSPIGIGISSGGASPLAFLGGLVLVLP